MSQKNIKKNQLPEHLKISQEKLESLINNAKKELKYEAQSKKQALLRFINKYFASLYTICEILVLSDIFEVYKNTEKINHQIAEQTFEILRPTLNEMLFLYSLSARLRDPAADYMFSYKDMSYYDKKYIDYFLKEVGYFNTQKPEDISNSIY